MVKGGVARIDLPAGWTYLQQDEARYVVERVWGNPPNVNTRGLILPPGDKAWGGIIVSYLASGYVTDDGLELDADVLLTEIRDDIAVASHLRQRTGRADVELLGWAEPPHYDVSSKKLRWGKKLRVMPAGKLTVNYDMRVLGAEGFLAMQAVIDADVFGGVLAELHQVLEGTSLAPGIRYDDHDPTKHRASNSGLAELVLGSRRAAVRVPLFRVLLKPLIALVVVVIALVVSARRSRARVATGTAT